MGCGILGFQGWLAVGHGKGLCKGLGGFKDPQHLLLGSTHIARGGRDVGQAGQVMAMHLQKLLDYLGPAGVLYYPLVVPLCSNNPTVHARPEILDLSMRHWYIDDRK